MNHIKDLLNTLLASGRREKLLILVVMDALMIPAVLWLTWTQLAGYWWLPIRGGAELLVVATVASVACLAISGVYKAVVRAFDETFLRTLLLAMLLYSVVLIAALTLLPWAKQPFSAAFLSTVFSTSLIFFWVWGSRTAIRALGLFLGQVGSAPARVVIYGAGAAGRQLLAALRRETGHRPVAFLDDDASLHGSVIAGLPVRRGTLAKQVIQRFKANKVFIAMPGASRQKRREVIQRLEPLPVHVRVLPGFSELAHGHIQFNDLREVEIEDLLGRESVAPKPLLFSANIAGLNVMVTGAGGSIGAELCRQILVAAPRRLVLLDHSEYALYAIHQELEGLASAIEIVPVLGNVVDEQRMAFVMDSQQVQTVYHAAAYKHVPLVESNPFQGVRNNAMGTLHLARAAMACGVDTFVLISTDKAVRPTNVMGASKRLAELVLQMWAADANVGKTRFTMVRFGNVLASSGSVVPLFRKQIAAGGPITLTHAEVTRYFMTINEAAQLVIQAGAMGRGGDVFVLDMGSPIKIIDLARLMIRLSGLDERTLDNPDGDIEIKTVGLRPGEKLYEELLIGTGDAQETQHPKIMKVFEPSAGRDALMGFFDELEARAQQFDVPWLKDRLAELVEGYAPAAEPLGSVDRRRPGPRLGVAARGGATVVTGSFGQRG
ncbi:polysaccharide biosynthesis protein [Polycyclovorans algicola]|uniref:polysaccharide biosynthesis protein n=1 Tax=Polycyclovorans algicola TaxID=616992 RepID=UPI00069336E9|nr:nucleoside-diphosphate sugar epimerase/dehydratase [Polycyclovorans algicola]